MQALREKGQFVWIYIYRYIEILILDMYMHICKILPKPLYDITIVRPTIPRDWSIRSKNFFIL